MEPTPTNINQPDGIIYSNLINQICEPLFKRLGITNFGYYELRENGDYFCLNSDPNHLEALEFGGFTKRTPIIMLEAYPKQGVSILDADLYAQQFVQDYIELRKEFNYDHSFRYQKIYEDSNGRFVRQYGFESARKNSDINLIYLNNLHLFNNFFEYFNHRILPLRAKVKKKVLNQNEILLLKNYMDLNSSHIINNTSLAKNNMNFETKNQFILTAREKEVVRYCIVGKTSRETAQVMGLSKRTIDRYFEDIRKKLSCKSKQQIVTIALSEDLV